MLCVVAARAGDSPRTPAPLLSMVTSDGIRRQSGRTPAWMNGAPRFETRNDLERSGKKTRALSTKRRQTRAWEDRRQGTGDECLAVSLPPSLQSLPRKKKKKKKRWVPGHPHQGREKRDTGQSWGQWVLRDRQRGGWCWLWTSELWPLPWQREMILS